MSISDAELIRSLRVHAGRSREDGWHARAVYMEEAAERLEAMTSTHNTGSGLVNVELDSLGRCAPDAPVEPSAPERKWTAGPWFVGSSDDGRVWSGGIPIDSVPGFEAVAATTRGWPDGVAEANAALIAAAPELAEAVSNLLHWHDEVRGHLGGQTPGYRANLDAYGRAIETARAAWAKATTGHADGCESAAKPSGAK